MDDDCSFCCYVPGQHQTRYHISVLIDMEYNYKLTNEVQRLTAIETLANAIDAKDKYTNGHSYRVSEYSVLLVKNLDGAKSR